METYPGIGVGLAIVRPSKKTGASASIPPTVRQPLLDGSEWNLVDKSDQLQMPRLASHNVLGRRAVVPFFTTKGESGTGLSLWITSDVLRKYHATMRP